MSETSSSVPSSSVASSSVNDVAAKINSAMLSANNSVKNMSASLNTNIANMKGSFNKFKAGSMINKIIIVVIAIFIILMAAGGVSIKKNCSLDSANINKKIIEFFMGFGSGMLIYGILDVFNIVSLPVILIISLFLSVYGAILVYSINHLDAKCESSLLRELSMGLMGAGIGMLYYALLNMMLSMLKNPLTKGRLIALLTSIFLIVIPSVVFNMRQKCRGESSWVDPQKDKQISSLNIAGFVVGGVVTLGILISFWYIPPTA
jgi:hypothetical protein